MNTIKQITIIIILIFYTLCQSKAGVIHPSSCDMDTIKVAINMALAGDTILLPGGTYLWNSNDAIRINKQLTLKGAGDNYNNKADSTVIITGHTLNWSAILILEPKNPEDIIRISNIIWKTDTTANNKSYTICIKGPAENIIIDSCNFSFGESSLPYISNNIATRGKVYGLIHHCLFNNSAREVISLVGDGDSAWESSDSLGTQNALYIEDCKFVKNISSGHAITGVNGAKWVSRYNEIINCDLDVHGYCFNGRSQYTFESYNDVINQSGYQWSYYIRGGTGVVYNAVIKGQTFSPIFRVYRIDYNCYMGGCCLEYPCLDQVGRGKNQRLNPVYFWNNTINENHTIVGLHSAPYGVCAEQEQSDYIKPGRDYFENIPKPDYVPFQYPHPLAYKNIPGKHLNIKHLHTGNFLEINWEAILGADNYKIYRNWEEIVSGITDTNWIDSINIQEAVYNLAAVYIIAAIRNSDGKILSSEGINVNQTFTSGSNKCFGASDTLIVAGNNTTVTFQSGSSVNLFAGNSIQLLPGTHIQQGAYFQASITTDRSFCEQIQQTLISTIPIAPKSKNYYKSDSAKTFIEQSIKVFPNPNNGKFTVKVEGINQTEQIVIYNSLGALVYYGTINYEKNIDLSNVNRGLYFICITGNNKLLHQKFLIE